MNNKSKTEITVHIVSCELAADSRTFKDNGVLGGFVSCLVPTNDIREAIDLAEKALAEDGYSIKRIERVEYFDKEEWENSPEVINGCNEAAQSNQLIYTTFNLYHNEYEN